MPCACGQGAPYECAVVARSPAPVRDCSYQISNTRAVQQLIRLPGLSQSHYSILGSLGSGYFALEPPQPL